MLSALLPLFRNDQPEGSVFEDTLPKKEPVNFPTNICCYDKGKEYKTFNRNEFVRTMSTSKTYVYITDSN
jgi:hypothetical protein